MISLSDEAEAVAVAEEFDELFSSELLECLLFGRPICQPRRSEVGFLLIHDGDFDLFKCFLPIDGPPLHLQGAPVAGPCHRVLHLHPELTGLGVNCNYFLVFLNTSLNF